MAERRQQTDAVANHATDATVADTHRMAKRAGKRMWTPKMTAVIERAQRKRVQHFLQSIEEHVVPAHEATPAGRAAAATEKTRLARAAAATATRNAGKEASLAPRPPLDMTGSIIYVARKQGATAAMRQHIGGTSGARFTKMIMHATMVVVDAPGQMTRMTALVTALLGLWVVSPKVLSSNGKHGMRMKFHAALEAGGPTEPVFDNVPHTAC